MRGNRLARDRRPRRRSLDRPVATAVARRPNGRPTSRRRGDTPDHRLRAVERSGRIGLLLFQEGSAWPFDLPGSGHLGHGAGGVPAHVCHPGAAAVVVLQADAPSSGTCPDRSDARLACLVERSFLRAGASLGSLPAVGRRIGGGHGAAGRSPYGWFHAAGPAGDIRLGAGGLLRSTG